MDITTLSVILLSLGSRLHLSSAQKSLNLTSEPPFDGSFCPGQVNFICRGTEIPFAMNWMLDDAIVASYSLDVSHTYPFNLNIEPTAPSSLTGVVNDASLNPNVANSLDITTTLSVANVSVLNGTLLRCQDTLGFGSNGIDISNIGYPSFPTFHCFIRQGPEITLQWSSFFNSQYNVDRYHVKVTPDTSSCSSDQVPFSEDYSCSGLELGTNYSISISAFNCWDQEGDEEVYQIFIHRPPPPNVLNITATYDGKTSLLSEVQVYTHNNVNTSNIECSEDVYFMSENYSAIITVENSTGSQTHMLAAEKNHCNVVCAASFNITRALPNETYRIFFSFARTISLTPSLHYYPNEIFGSSYQLFNYTLTAIMNGVVFALCESQMESIKECKIQYGTDPSYSNLSIPVSGPIGSPFPVCLLDGNSVMYYHQALVEINQTLQVIIRSSDAFIISTADPTTVTNHSSVITLEVYQLGLFVVILMVMIIALVISIGVIIKFIYKVNYYRSKRFDLAGFYKAAPLSSENVGHPAQSSAKDTVYEEIPESVMHFSSNPKPPEVQLTENAAYHRGMYTS